VVAGCTRRPAKRSLLLGNFVKAILGVNGAESQALFRIFQGSDHMAGEHDSVELGNSAMGRDVGQPCDPAFTGRLRLSARNVVPCIGSRFAGDIPVSIHGERSRAVSGDASDYSIVDSPNNRWWPDRAPSRSLPDDAEIGSRSQSPTRRPHG